MTDQNVSWCGPWHDPHRYRIVGPSAVGRGGEGLVHRAERVSDGVEVAVKLLTATRVDTYPRIAARSAALATVDHPNVMKHAEVFLSAGLTRTDDELDNEDYSVVTSVEHWVDGKRLDDMPTDARAQEYLRWVAQIARGVHALHHLSTDDAPRGIAHRDIKPSNVLITRDRVAVLIDFGTAKPLDPSADATRGIGTYGWSPPEAGVPGGATEQADELSVDAWGVGVLAYWAVCRAAPSADLDAEERRTRIAQAARAAGLPDPGGLAAHIGRCLSTAGHRPRNLNTWADELEALVRPRSVSHSRRALASAGALALCGVAVAVIVPQLEHRAASETPSASTSILEVATTVSAPLASTSTTEAVATTVSAESDDGTSPNEVAFSPDASSVAISPDGDSIAVSVGDAAEIFDVFWLVRNHAAGYGTAPDVTLVGHRGDVNSAEFSPDGTKVVTTSADATARVWDAATGAELLVLSGHTGFVAGPAVFSPNGAQILTTSSDGTARVWDAETGDQLLQLGTLGGSVGDAIFSPDGRSILVQVDAQLVVFDSSTGGELARLNGDISDLRSPTFSPDGSMILTSSDSRRKFRGWSASTGELLFDADGVTGLYSPAGDVLVNLQEDGTVRFMTPTGSDFSAVPDTVEQAPCWNAALARLSCRAAFGADGTRLVTSDGGGGLTMWDVPFRSKIATVGEGLAPERIIISADGSRVLALDEERGAILWTGFGTASSGTPEEGAAWTPGCIRDGEVGPSCGEIAEALDAITVRYPTAPFFETDHLFEDGSRGAALGWTMGWTTTGVEPFSAYEAPDGSLVRAMVSMAFRPEEGTDPEVTVWAFTAMPDGRGIGSFPSSPIATISYGRRNVVPTAEFISTEVIMEIIVCDSTNTECDVTRTLRRPVKPSEALTL